MKKIFLIFLIIWIYLYSHPVFLHADNVMMCTFFQNPVARVYKVSDEGDITFDYNVTVGGYPLTIVFSPDGKWGLVGGDTTYGHPERQITVVLSVDENRDISVLGTAHNELYELVAISPDSRYGVYGCDLKTLRFNNETTFTVISTENECMCGVDGSFSSLNNYLYVENGYKTIVEYTLLPDGRTTDTGFTLDISPSTGYWDLNITPDGRTLVALSMETYRVTSLRINEEGGCSIAHQFDPGSYNPGEVDFTPDSKYAVISFVWSINNLKIYSIGEDSKLTETDSITLPEQAGEDMAVTPDGKYVVTRALINSYSYFYVVRITEDGKLEYLPEKDYVCTGHVSAIAFVPPQIHGVSWILY
jgi:WD40 repeat protein